MGPIRTCVGCRQRRLDHELLRITQAQGVVVVGRGSGRGAWLCPQQACLEAALKRGAFARALKSAVDGAAVRAAVEGQLVSRA